MATVLKKIGLCILVLLPVLVHAQTDSTQQIDTVVIAPEDEKKAIRQAPTLDTIIPHSPRKAMILSAVLPGAGQIYNRKYWKAPVVWAGFVVLGYFINQNTHQYRRFKKAYIYNTDNDSSTVSEFPNVSPDLIANERNIYRKWRDLSIILTVGWYALNIIDANVDAHLFEFNLIDDMTLRWEPTFNMAYNQPKPFSGGVRLTLGF